MGSPVSPLIANLFMEEFEIRATSSAPNLNLWIRHRDETFANQWAEQSHHLLQHINSQDTHIQFTKEDSNEEGALPFLDTTWFPQVLTTP